MTMRPPYDQGFARVASCTLHSHLAEPARNARDIALAARALHQQGVAVAVFPELCISGYAIDDLLLQQALQDGVQDALLSLARDTADCATLLLVGAPLRHGARLYNCAVAIHRGRLLGAVPKTYLPNYSEFYEKRHFGSAAHAPPGPLRMAGQELPFGTDLVFAATDLPKLRIAAEICEDLWVPQPPSGAAALAGATVLANLSASNITIGKAETRSLLCRAQSARCIAAYLYAAAGSGESTTDLAWDGQAAIFENGTLLAQTERFPLGSAQAIADIDLDGLMLDRVRQGSFDDNRAATGPSMREIAFTLDFAAWPPTAGGATLRRTLPRHPFVPSDADRLRQDCYEAVSIQVAGLSQRLSATGLRHAVIGVSGGLDSTQALIVAARAFDRLGLPRSHIRAVTMPGFATGSESRAQAHALMDAIGVHAQELDIVPAATRMLADLGHPAADGAALYDITYENVQAGLRTDYLFRLANMHQGLVIGTGDMSELALGWCTYGVGDQMSHYNVNAGVPKTLIQHLIRFTIAEAALGEAANATLSAILAAEISPELIPGATAQSTQATIGPYELHDFFLFHFLRGAAPGRIAFLAEQAWSGTAGADTPCYDRPTILHWLRVFLTRFFAAQFKRSAMPNGPKISRGGALSPRGDWRAPSDAAAQTWLAALDRTGSAETG